MFHTMVGCGHRRLGHPPEQTFRVIGAVMDLGSTLEINLVDVNTCSPSLLKAIEQEAVDL